MALKIAVLYQRMCGYKIAVLYQRMCGYKDSFISEDVWL